MSSYRGTNPLEILGDVAIEELSRRKESRNPPRPDQFPRNPPFLAQIPRREESLNPTSPIRLPKNSHFLSQPSLIHLLNPSSTKAESSNSYSNLTEEAQVSTISQPLRQEELVEVNSSSLDFILNPSSTKTKTSNSLPNLTEELRENTVPQSVRQEKAVEVNSSSIEFILNPSFTKTKPSNSLPNLTEIAQSITILQPVKHEKFSQVNNSSRFPCNLPKKANQSTSPLSTVSSTQKATTATSPAIGTKSNVKNIHGINSPLSSPSSSASQIEPNINNSIPKTDFINLKDECAALKNYCPTSTPTRIPLSQKPSIPYLHSKKCYNHPSKKSKFEFNFNTYNETYVRNKYPEKFKKPNIEDIEVIGTEGLMKKVQEIVYDRGEPLIVKNFHRIDFNSNLFSLKNLESQFEDQIHVVNPTTRIREKMYFSEFLKYARSQNEPSSVLYAKDLEAPLEWTQTIKSYIPKEIHYNGPYDLMGYLPVDLKSPNIEIYVGKGGTYTPFHIDVCGSQGHNLMVATEGNASSLWIMAGAKDVHAARRYIDENSSEQLSSDLDNSLLNLEQMSNFPNRFYLFEQNLGDFVFVPSQSMHSVINLGTGISTKLSWNITTPKSLYHTIIHFSHLYRSIFKGESYRNKAMVYYTCEKWSKYLNKIPRNPSKEQTDFIVENFPIIHTLLSNMVAQVYFPKTHQYPNLPIKEMKEIDPFKRTCDFCKADIFNTFLTSIKPSTKKIPKSASSLCLNCATEGRYLSPNEGELISFVYNTKVEYYKDLLNTSADNFNTYIKSHNTKADPIQQLTDEDLLQNYEKFNTMRLAMDRVHSRLFSNNQECSFCHSISNGEHISCSAPNCTKTQCHKCIDFYDHCFLSWNSSNFKCSTCLIAPTKPTPQKERLVPNYYLTTMNYKYKLSLEKNLYTNPLEISCNTPSFYDKAYLTIPKTNKKKRLADDGESVDSNSANPQKTTKAKKPRMPKSKAKFPPSIKTSQLKEADHSLTVTNNSKAKAPKPDPILQAAISHVFSEIKNSPKLPKASKQPNNESPKTSNQSKSKIVKAPQPDKKRPLDEGVKSSSKAQRHANARTTKTVSKTKPARSTKSKSSSPHVVTPTQHNVINQAHATNLIGQSSPCIAQDGHLHSHPSSCLSDSSPLSPLTDISSTSSSPFM